MFWRAMAAAVLSVVMLSSPAAAERRVALVIGNSDYRAAVKLPNTRNDAQVMTAMLNDSGFKVFSGLNLTQQTMADKLAEFATAAADADVALFFYAGHAIQIAGRNLIVPVEADIKSEFHANSQTIDIDQITNGAMGSAKVKIVLLDACRDNPFAEVLKRGMGVTRSVQVADRGLAEMKPGQGSLIGFATGPGQTALDGKNGGNSPFTKALITHLATPGLEIRHALTRVRAQVQEETNQQQLPWENTNMTGFFYLKKPVDQAQQIAALNIAATPGTATEASAPVTATGKTDEQRMWDSADSLQTAAGYQIYIDRYPFGQFADMARAKIAALGSTARSSAAVGSPEAASEATEDALELKRNDWRTLQDKLANAGYAVKIDGKIGEGTRDAIRSWQSREQLASTGYLNKPQYDRLMALPSSQSAKAQEGQPRRRSYSSGEGGSRQQQSNGGGSSADTAKVMQGVLAIGAGIAIGRALRR